MLKRLIKSFSYAFRGLAKIFKEEQNLQIQSIFAIIVISLGALFKITKTDWCFIIISVTLVVLMEIINSAVERIADALKPRIHVYIKEMKDIMAGAVMISAFMAIAIGLIIFIPYILIFLK